MPMQNDGGSNIIGIKINETYVDEIFIISLKNPTRPKMALAVSQMLSCSQYLSYDKYTRHQLSTTQRNLAYKQRAMWQVQITYMSQYNSTRESSSPYQI